MKFATCCLAGLVLLSGVQAESFDVDADGMVGLKHPGPGHIVNTEREVYFVKHEPIPSSFIRVAAAVDSLPLSHMFRGRERVLKLGKFFSDSQFYLNHQMKVKPPLDIVAMLFMVAVLSYVPSLLIALCWHCIKGKPKPTYSPELYRYNAQDIQDINMIL